jgi:hypothetical protein
MTFWRDRWRCRLLHRTAIRANLTASPYRPSAKAASAFAMARSRFWARNSPQNLAALFVFRFTIDSESG